MSFIVANFAATCIELMSGAKSRKWVHHNSTRGSSSVLFAYSFLLQFGQIDNIYKVQQDWLYFFS